MFSRKLNNAPFNGLKITRRWGAVEGWDWGLGWLADPSGHLLPYWACAAAPRLSSHVKHHFSASFPPRRPSPAPLSSFSPLHVSRDSRVRTNVQQARKTHTVTREEGVDARYLAAPSFPSAQEVHLPVSSHQPSSGDRAALELRVNAIKMPCWVKISVVLLLRRGECGAASHPPAALTFPALWPFHLPYLPQSNLDLNEILIMYSLLFTFGPSILALRYYCPLACWFFCTLLPRY